MLHYPQHGTSDVIQAASSEDLLVEQLAVLLPEREDEEIPPPGWDRLGEYQLSKVVVYVARAAPQEGCSSLSEWLGVCQRQWLLERGEEDGEGGGVTEKGQVEGEGSGAPAAGGDFYEVHLGCSLRTVLRAQGVLLSGGVLRLLVFPREGSKAHEMFRSKADIKSLLPS